nr:Chain A, MHB8A peptide [synthetic construct]
RGKWTYNGITYEGGGGGGGGSAAEAYAKRIAEAMAKG